MCDKLELNLHCLPGSNHYCPLSLTSTSTRNMHMCRYDDGAMLQICFQSTHVLYPYKPYVRNLGRPKAIPIRLKYKCQSSSHVKNMGRPKAIPIHLT